ncbi:OmpA family protein [Persephonella sp. KM09-Lau-8]|uniref:OmpA family protein n=1 Tax=Persephonella sp. KM09-Lau-8 TaxID=1158345 RepID=UPI00049752CE|nr:OmpA family protein [Persephonella sp. KM09-Lau-8]
MMRILSFMVMSLVSLFFSCSLKAPHTASENTIEKPSVYQETDRLYVVEKFTFVKYSALSKISYHKNFYLMAGDNLYQSLEPAVLIEVVRPSSNDSAKFTFPEVPDFRKISVSDAVVVYFPFDSAKLTDKERKKLDLFLRKITKHRNYRVKITGFTDKVGTKEYNDKLALKRAKAVASYLKSKNKRLKVSVSGFGKCCYVSEKDEKNRRAEVNAEK